MLPKKNESPQAFSKRMFDAEKKKSKTGPEAGKVLNKIALKTPKSKQIEAQKKTLPPVAKKFVAVKNPLPFNLEMAKAGVPLQTRSGKEAIFVTFDPRLREEDQVIFGVYLTLSQGKQFLRQYAAYPDGKFEINDSNDYDLFMNVAAKEKWVALQYYENLLHIDRFYSLFDTERAALNFAASHEPLLVPPFKIKLPV